MKPVSAEHDPTAPAPTRPCPLLHPGEGQPVTVAPPAAGSQPPVPLWRRPVDGRSLLVAFAILAVLLAGRLTTTTAPYLASGPGPAPDVVAGLTGDVADPGFGDHGTIRFTTIEVVEVTWFRYLTTQLFGDPSELTPVATEGIEHDDRRVGAVAAMAESKQIAYSVATAIVSGTPFAEAGGVQVLAVRPAGPAAIAGIGVGDVITAVDGVPVSAPTDVADRIARAGDRVTLTVTGPGRTTPAVVDAALDDGVLGVELGDAAAPDVGDVPFEVDTSGIGGPSAGLMFTLAFVDALSPGDLTADLDIAGTGTIRADGTVGPIGGVRHKAAAAAGTGADVFFVPADQSVRGITHDGMDVVQVRDALDAVDWLCAAGAADAVCARR